MIIFVFMWVVVIAYIVGEFFGNGAGAATLFIGIVLTLLLQHASAHAFRNMSPKEQSRVIQENSDFMDRM